VTVTDGTTGCANSGSGTVTVNANPTPDAGPAQTICAGTPVEIGGSPTANGGTGPYTYLWSPATGLDDATLVWSSLSGQTYRVQYTADLTAPVTWTDLTGPDSNRLLPEVTASGATATFTDSSATDTIRFYQVSVVCP
jgi:hypothetical protein